MKICFVLCSIFPLAFSRITPCPNGQGSLPKFVTIIDCENDQDCDFSRGKTVLGDFEFEAPMDITALTPTIYMTLGDKRGTKATTNAPDDRLVGCDWLLGGYKCPIAKGKSAIWRLNLPISRLETISSAAIEIQMRAENNSTIFCAIIWGIVYPF